MKKSFSNAQMRAADEYTMKTLGVPSLTLMERAGAAVCKQALQDLQLLGLNEALIVCGGGNNGGDGFVSARLLKEYGVEVTVLCLAQKFSPDCGKMKEKYGGEILNRIPRRRYPFIIDCIFGTGLSRNVEGEELALINFINSSAAFVLSVDIPSGLNGDNGIIMGTCVRASKTLAVGEYKNGHFLCDGIDVCGEVLCVDIGIDASPLQPFCAQIAQKRDIAKFFPKRRRNTHKGSYGKVSIIAGSKAYSGAAFMATMSALKGGAGYVELCIPVGLFSAYAGKMPEAILTCFKGENNFVYCEKDLEKLLNSNCIAFGMGCGVSLDVYKMICYLLKNYTGKLLLDADALNTLAKYGKEVLKDKKCSLLLTPHVKEFSRLTQLFVPVILQNATQCVQDFALEYGLSVLLKNAVSVLYGENQTFFNVKGSACLAKGGSGDVLAGLISSLCAQGHTLTQAAFCASYIMGLAGELCQKEMGEYSVTASDVIRYIPKAILSVTENAHD